jgi:hypothetical protein
METRKDNERRDQYNPRFKPLGVRGWGQTKDAFDPPNACPASSIFFRQKRLLIDHNLVLNKLERCLTTALTSSTSNNITLLLLTIANTDLDSTTITGWS